MIPSQGTAWFLASIQPAMHGSGIKNTCVQGIALRYSDRCRLREGELFHLNAPMFLTPAPEAGGFNKR